MTQRTILFRGQTRHKGDRASMSGEPLPGVWVMGGVFPQNKGYDYAIIYQQEPKVEKYVVYAETVGQYTDIIDSIGTQVLEEFRDSWKGYNEFIAEKAQSVLDAIALLLDRDGDSQ